MINVTLNKFDGYAYITYKAPEKKGVITYRTGFQVRTEQIGAPGTESH